MDNSMFNPLTYSNVPNSEVDWASLAQRWIQTKAHADPKVHHAVPPHPVMPPEGLLPGQNGSFGGYRGPPQPQGPGFGYPAPPNRYPPQAAPYFEQPGYPPPTGFFHNRPDFRPQFFNTGPKPRPPPLPHVTPTFPIHNVGLVQPAQPLPVQPLFQAVASASVTEAVEMNTPSGGVDLDTMDGAMAHWMDDMNNDPDHWTDERIDMASRKKLPQWILEGLEKAEKEKRKQMEKEQQAKQDAQKELEREERRIAKGKSKFESDSEDEDAEDKVLESKPAFAPNSLIGNKAAYVKEDFDQNETRAVKRLMVSVLMEASDIAVQDQVNRVLERLKHHGKKVIPSTSALQALSAIAQYTDDEDTTDDDGDRPSDNATGSDKVMEETGLRDKEGFKHGLDKDKQRNDVTHRSGHGRDENENKRHSKGHKKRSRSNSHSSPEKKERNRDHRERRESESGHREHREKSTDRRRDSRDRHSELKESHRKRERKSERRSRSRERKRSKRSRS